MKYVSNLNELQDIPGFSPPHHAKTTDRKLIDEEAGAQHFALWHGEVEPGGTAEPHFHEEMEQVFIVLEGEGLFKIGDQEHRLGKGNIVFAPVKCPHQVTSVGDTALKVLIFMAPPPGGFEAWRKK